MPGSGRTLAQHFGGKTKPRLSLAARYGGWSLAVAVAD